MSDELRKFTVEDLKQYNGQDGKPAYIGFQDRVIDVTGSKLWRNGSHMKRHVAGEDLTKEIEQAPHGVDVLDRYPQVGVLIRQPEPAAADAGELPAFVERFLDRHPFFRRHLHPMTVHFPIAFFICAPVFLVLYWITGVKGFELTSVNCIAGGDLVCLFTIPAGFFTWWVNYMARPIRQVVIKITVSLIMFADGVGVFVWRLADHTVAGNVVGINILYAVLVCALAVFVFVVGWYGASLTFPLKKKE